MKRIFLFVLMITLFSGSLLFAQNRGQWNWPGIPNIPERPERTEPEKITISGNLGIARGQIALETGGKTYYLLGLDRFIGFIDGLREGAAVQVEGYTGYAQMNRNHDTENEVYMRVTQLVLGGKTYDMDNGFPGTMGLNFGRFDMPDLSEMRSRMMERNFQQPWFWQNNNRRR